ncbi:hypothetical protein CLAFUW4_12262 [Fulvia fulva]|uniref:Wax synthase domain-containing protein n=1 Tax=Passalora fulva TaxID=5499 RepID=A0A9Q8UT33_PASFU|nr:uncharacterized protein CLAFUR5_11292 [Fulvia fulva]KAK4618277.1 hypothetical protein CLAFUR4_12267 [Fulvia fulva]KAK4618535.1 hypothetical protein CLAFUR0_12278 [Fulvia fulva]UJO21370.1 hypothetical protein CLAFUR5_11292 [Fulvia fulva]WPV18120.1 hypothetical protein CLAFUW4_12262 [Fulvia fulva]WPV33514.1 hypothetical protein CLAFUW7_12269 [Fulvia fulva]
MATHSVLLLSGTATITTLSLIAVYRSQDDASVSISRTSWQGITIWAVRSITLHTLALLSLSYSASTKQSILAKKDPSAHDLRKMDKLSSTSIFNTMRVIGTIASLHLLAIPLLYPNDGPLQQVSLRVACFFFACKLLDLTLARAHKPPTRLKNGKAIHIQTAAERLSYCWLLLSQCRYHSFDIAVVEKNRTGPAKKSIQYGIPLVIVVMTFLFPIAEVLILFALVAIQFGLEGCHLILDPHFTHPLFWQPFAAPSISEFWSTHWHQGARPLLYSLGYMPANAICGRLFGKKAGRIAGVLATFSLSGIWHGWCAAALSKNPWRTALGLWAMFVAHGVLCILERVIWGKQQGSIVQRVTIWGIALLLAGAWLRDSLVRSRLEWPVS